MNNKEEKIQYHITGRNKCESEEISGNQWDNIGSTTLLTNKDGSDIGQFLYTPFGEMWVEEASEVDISHITRFFTNQQYDKESGLYYMNARYYDPHLGSFIMPDPAMDGLNHYAYCSANPVKYSDPTGLSDDQYDNYVSGIEAVENSIEIANGNISSPPSVPSQSGQDIPYGDQLLSPEEYLQKCIEDFKWYSGGIDITDFLKEVKFINGWDYDINEKMGMLLDEVAYYHGLGSDLFSMLVDIFEMMNPSPTIFTQTQFDQFGIGANNTACALTVLLNYVSIEFTKQAGIKMDLVLVNLMIDKLMSISIINDEKVVNLVGKDATVNSGIGVLQESWNFLNSIGYTLSGHWSPQGTSAELGGQIGSVKDGWYGYFAGPPLSKYYDAHYYGSGLNKNYYCPYYGIEFDKKPAGLSMEYFFKFVK